jgi:hypothetical protein
VTSGQVLVAHGTGAHSIHAALAISGLSPGTCSTAHGAFRPHVEKDDEARRSEGGIAADSQDAE